MNLRTLMVLTEAEINELFPPMTTVGVQLVLLVAAGALIAGGFISYITNCGAKFRIPEIVMIMGLILFAVGCFYPIIIAVID